MGNSVNNLILFPVISSMSESFSLNLKEALEFRLRPCCVKYAKNKIFVLRICC